MTRRTSKEELFLRSVRKRRQRGCAVGSCVGAVGGEATAKQPPPHPTTPLNLNIGGLKSCALIQRHSLRTRRLPLLFHSQPQASTFTYLKQSAIPHPEIGWINQNFRPHKSGTSLLANCISLNVWWRLWIRLQLRKLMGAKLWNLEKKNFIYLTYLMHNLWKILSYILAIKENEFKVPLQSSWVLQKRSQMSLMMVMQFLAQIWKPVSFF